MPGILSLGPGATLDDLDDLILPLVSRPGRYSGAINGLVTCELGSADFSACVCGPDLFEAAVMHGTLNDLYYGLDDLGGAVDLTFAPAADFEQEMRQHGLPLTGIESRHRVADFDLIVVTVTSELQATGVLNIIDLAGLALRAADRAEDAPLVIGVGPGLVNPEPLAPFFDAVVLGDVDAFLDTLAEAARGVRRDGRKAALAALGAQPGAYVPSLVPVAPGANGLLVTPEGAPTIAARYTEGVPAPTRRLQPLIEVRDDALELEVMRGCPMGCRFCQPARTGGPVREMSGDAVCGTAEALLADGGWDELSIGGLMPAAWSQLGSGLDGVGRQLLGSGTAVSLAAAAPTTLTTPVLAELSRVRRTALHIAPEAGSARLRQVLGKPLDEIALVESVKRVAMLGWPALRLHFMVGVPTETSDDLAAIVEFCETVRSAGKRPGSGLKLHIMVHPFVPKSHTPFQWEAQLPAAELEARLKTLRGACRRVAARLKWRRPAMSEIEGLLARGDRRVADLIESAYRAGARLDNWSEFHQSEIWTQVIESSELDTGVYHAAFDLRDRLPWSRLSLGSSTERLAEEYERAMSGESALPPVDAPRVASGTGSTRPDVPEAVSRRAFGRGLKRRRGPASAADVASQRERVCFSKSDRLRFVSHLDVVRLFDRALRRAGCPVAYSTGFSRHPRLSFGPPLAVGMTSRGEYFDVEFTEAPPEDLVARLNAVLPYGLRVLVTQPIRHKVDSLMVYVDHADYRVVVPPAVWSLIDDPPSFTTSLNEAVHTFLSRDRASVVRRGSDRSTTVEIRSGVRRLELTQLGDDASPILDMSLRISGNGSVRPLDLLQMLVEENIDPRLLRVERLRLYHHEGDRDRTPFDALTVDERPVGTVSAVGVEQPVGSLHVQGNRYQRRSRRNKDRNLRRW